MAEYIEREAAIREIVKNAVKHAGDPDITDDMVHAVQCLLAADVAPVRHGLWIWDDEGYHCSECFYHAYGETAEVLSGNWHYCPNCGAAMDGGETDG